MLLSLLISCAFAFTLPSRFIKAEQFDGVTQYRDSKSKIELSVSPSKLKFEELTQDGINEAAKLFKVKAEYGEMFGFKKWSATRHKLFDDPKNGRSWVIEGTYESLEGKKIYFLEIYWANQNSAQEFLFTSEETPFNLDKYTELFKP